MQKLAGEPLTLELNSGWAARAERQGRADGGPQRGLWLHPGLRGEVSAGPPLSAAGRSSGSAQPSPSSASYVPEDLCAPAWGAGGGDNTSQKAGEPHACGKGGWGVVVVNTDN